MAYFPVIGNYAAPSAAENNYASIAGAGGVTWSNTVDRGATNLPDPADFLSSKLKTVAPGIGKAIEFIITKNGEVTAASMKLEGEETEKPWSGEVHFAEDDVIGLKCVPTGTPTVGPVAIESYMETESKREFYFWGTTTTQSKSAPRLYSLAGYIGTNFAVEELGAHFLSPMAGTVVKSAVKMTEGPSAGREEELVFRLNNTTDTLKMSFKPGETQKIVSGSQAFSAGDLMAMKCSPIGGESSVPRIVGCLSIEPAVAGEHFFGIHGTTGAVAARFYYMRGISGWNSTEASVASYPLTTLTARKLRGDITVPAGTGKKGVYALRSDGVATALSLEFKDAEVTKGPTVGDVTLPAGKLTTFGFTPTGSPPNPGAHHFSYVIFTEQPEVIPPKPPTATTESATAVDDETAILHGKVGPEGLPTTYYFEYGKTTGYGLKSPELSAGEGGSPKAVEALLEGLEPSTTYHFRLVAINKDGTTKGSDLTLATTATPAPSVTTEAPDALTNVSAVAHGKVNPHGEATKVYVEYGKTISYGSKTAEVEIGKGTVDQAVEATIEGLTKSTTYHFRVVAVSKGGTTTGADKTFQTSGYEFKTAPVTIFPDTEVDVEELIKGLEPETEYHFRLVAENAQGEDFGEDLKFTTGAAPAPIAGANSYVIDGSAMRPNKRWAKV